MKNSLNTLRNPIPTHQFNPSLFTRSHSYRETGVNAVPYDVNMIIYTHKLLEVNKNIQTFDSCDDFFTQNARR